MKLQTIVLLSYNAAIILRPANAFHNSYGALSSTLDISSISSSTFIPRHASAGNILSARFHTQTPYSSHLKRISYISKVASTSVYSSKIYSDTSPGDTTTFDANNEFNKNTENVTLSDESGDTNSVESTADKTDIFTICRVVANGDGKLPFYTTLSSAKDNPESFALYEKINSIYHARSHKETSHLQYLQEWPRTKTFEYIDQEEQELVSTLRSSLEGAGFELLNQRDLDLCDALNTGYLLRLSILPNTKQLDPLVGYEFYPNRTEGAFSDTSTDTIDNEKKTVSSKTLEPLIFDGRVLIFRRGYSSEVSRGRLLLPKLDYLQASLVQRSASFFTDAIYNVQRTIVFQITQSYRNIGQSWRNTLTTFTDSIPNEKISSFFKKSMGLVESKDGSDDDKIKQLLKNGKKEKLFKLARYGGSKVRFVGAPDERDAITPFLLCEIKDTDDPNETTEDSCNNVKLSPTNNSSEIKLPMSSLDDNVSQDNKILYAGLESGQVGCKYDAVFPSESSSSFDSQNSFRLLERVSISNVVDFFSNVGRRKLVKNFISETELVEPTYEEVVVIWRPLPDKKPPRPKFRIPSVVYDIAEIFAIDDRLPPKPPPPPKPQIQPLEIRIFNDVPMANLPAVLPKTRLIFRPADAFLFDLVSIFTLGAVLATQRYDNPKLDLIALISVSLWLLRTVLRYSNKLARYDLLVNKFLTSKLSQKGAGALDYILSEASKQRATRVGLLHTWMLKTNMALTNNAQNIPTSISSDDLESLSPSNGSSSREQIQILRSQLEQEGNVGINQLLRGEHTANIDIRMVMNDLEELNLIENTIDGKYVKHIFEGSDAMNKLRMKWMELFDDDGDNQAILESEKNISNESKIYL